MKIECLNGYYKFYPTSPYQLTLMQSLLKRQLVKKEDFFTFQALLEVEDYSIENTVLSSGAVYSKTFASSPEEVLFINKLTYDLESDKILPSDIIQHNNTYGIDQFKLGSKYLIQAYSKIENKKVISFSGYYNFDEGFFSYDKVVVQ